MATLVARPVQRRTDNVFFVSMSVLIFVTIVSGFARSYFLAGMMRAKLPSVLVHVHGAAFTAWIVLFVVQTVLVATRNVRLHRQLGTAGGVLAALMVVLGVMVTIATVRRGATPHFFKPGMFLVLNGYGVVVFGALVGWAILLRRRPAEHKRLMLLATFNLIPPAVGRMPLTQTHPPLIGLSLLVCVLILLAYDLVTRRKPYMVTVVGSLLVMSVFPIANIVGATPPLRAAATWLMQHP
jgi:hypothetical protein